MTTHPLSLETPLATSLAQSALAADAAAFPAEVLAKAKVCLLDFLSCAFESQGLPWSRQAIAITRRAETGANVIGTDVVATPADAAFANATLGHGLVREDMHAGSLSHHGVVVWPVLLALAQRAPIDGQSFLAAAVVGYEVGARLGRALFTSSLARLFRPTGIVGPIGAAVAGSRLIMLNAEAASCALALAANTSSGLNQWPHTGGSEMYFHPGFAARNAVTAVELAEQGAYASDSILEGEAGLFAAFKREPPAGPMVLFEDGRVEILSVYNKPVPACNFAQTACQAALQVARDLSAQTSAIESISIRVPDAAVRYPGCDFAGPFERPLQAKMSIQFGVAAALARGGIEEDNYRRLDDPEILRLVRIADLRSDVAFTSSFPDAQGAEVSVVLDGGLRLGRRLADVVAATATEVSDHFLRSVAAHCGDRRARDIEALIDGLENAGDVGRIAAMCAVRGNPSAGDVRSSRSRPAASG